MLCRFSVIHKKNGFCVVFDLIALIFGFDTITGVLNSRLFAMFISL